MFGSAGSLLDSFTLNALHNYSITLIAAAIISTGLPLRICKELKNKKSYGDIVALIGEGAGLTACIAYLVDASYNPFLYFNF